MKEIVDRLNERRVIERAKEILEDNGYRISKDSYVWSDWMRRGRRKSAVVKTYSNGSGKGIEVTVYSPGSYEGKKYKGYNVEFYDNDTGSWIGSVECTTEGEAIRFAERFVASQYRYNDGGK